MFQGQTDVDSVSLCLWHPCLLSLDVAAAAKWGEKRNAQSQSAYRSHTKSLRVLSGQKGHTSRSMIMPKCNSTQDEVVSVFSMTWIIPHKKYGGF